MVAERDLLDAVLVHRGRERAAAQLGAQRAGVLLPALEEHDLIDGDVHADVLHAERAAVIRHAVEAHARRARLNGHGDDPERLGIKAAQPRERGECEERILAAGDADGDGIARLDHVVILDAAAHEAQNFLHGSVFLPGNRVKFQFAISENESKLKKKRDFKSIDCAKLKWC